MYEILGHLPYMFSINKNSAEGYVAPAKELGWRKFTKSVNHEI